MNLFLDVLDKRCSGAVFKFSYFSIWIESKPIVWNSSFSITDNFNGSTNQVDFLPFEYQDS